MSGPLRGGGFFLTHTVHDGAAYKPAVLHYTMILLNVVNVCCFPLIGVIMQTWKMMKYEHTSFAVQCWGELMVW